MKITFSKREPGGVELGLIYGTIALLAMAAARLLPVSAFMPDCAFRVLTGFPCPTCGTTRALVNLSHARFFPAFAVNPLAFLCFAGLVFAFLYGAITVLFGVPRAGLSLSRIEKDIVRKGALLVVLLNWLYLFWAL